MFWVLQIFYKFTINLTKTSILLLYLRIFSAKSVCRWVYVTLGYVLCYAVASIFATIFQCTPIPRIWNHGLEGDCINLTAFWYANAASNIFSDIVILTLPMPLIGGLQLPRRQKFGLIFVFALGSL